MRNFNSAVGSQLAEVFAGFAGLYQAQVWLTLIGAIVAILCLVAFHMMTNTPEKAAAFAEKAGTYKYLPYGAWALARASK